MIHKLVPRFLWVLTQDVIVVRIQSHIVFLYISEKVIGTKDFGYFHKLIVIVFALEEWLLLKDHTCEHAPQ